MEGAITSLSVKSRLFYGYSINFHTGATYLI